MINTITGLFDSMDDAQSAAKELMDRGISRDNISLVARDSRTESVNEHEVGAAPVIGAGAVVGGAVGLLIGAGLLTIPIIGPILAIGPLAAAIGSTAAAVGATALGAGVGAGIGGLAGGLMSSGVPEEDAQAYVEGVRRGGTLLTVNIDSSMAERVDVDSVLHRYNVTDMNQRRADWRAAGWTPGTPTGDGDTDSAGSWKDSSKIGTVTGTATGAATGAAIGSVGGPIGTVIGGTAGAIVGAGTGAAGDVVGDRSLPADSYRGVNEYDQDTSSPRDMGNQQRSASSTQYDQDTSSPRDMGRQQRSGSFTQYDQDFRNHYQSTALAGGQTYEYYTPAYRFGYDMGGDTRYSSGRWDAVESGLRQDWEQGHPNSWAESKAAVRYAWEKVRGLR